METETPGVSHIMAGVPGKVKNWLQTEQGVGSLLTNPAALSGVVGPHGASCWTADHGRDHQLSVQDRREGR